MIKQLRKRKWVTGIKTAVIAAGFIGALSTVPVYADSVHTAKEGDTFYFLAKQYGVDMNQLMKANPDIKATNIYGGLKIKIPGGSTVKALSASGSKIQALSVPKVLSSERVVQAWGKTFNYSKTINVKATAYSADASENGWGPVDYYGNSLKLGTIAVDPNVIPMGTKVLVTGHSHPDLPKDSFVATAMDQGSAIKGNRIDIFIPASPQKVSQFGFQDVKLYVLE